MTQAFTEESELVEALKAVDKDFIGLGSEGHEFAARADFEVSDLVGVGNLCNWLCFIAIPEENGTA